MGRKVYEASVPCCKDVVIIAAHHAVSAKAGNSNTAGETNFLMVVREIAIMYVIVHYSDIDKTSWKSEYFNHNTNSFVDSVDKASMFASVRVARIVYNDYSRTAKQYKRVSYAKI